MLGEIIRVFLLCAAFLLTLILLGRGVQMRALMGSLNLNPGEFLLVLLYMSPAFMTLVVPLSCMLSVFLTVLRMNADRELIALRAGGISIRQMLPAPVFFSALCCLAALGISLYGISWGAANFRETVLQLAKNKAQLNLQPGIFNQDISGLTMFARRIDPATKTMYQVMVEDSSRIQEERLTILAPSGRIETNSKRGELVFKLSGGRIYRLGKDMAGILDFEEYNIRMGLEELFQNIDLGELKVREMSWDELHDTLAGLTPQSGGRLWFKLLVEIQQRLAMPVSSLVLGLFAVPLAAGFEGIKRQASVAIVLIAFLLYYSMHSLGVTLSESGRLHPVAAMWMSNAVFLTGALAGLALAEREGVPDPFRALKRLPARLRQGPGKAAA
jgi:lipopolysaccharide export system permease protein